VKGLFECATRTVGNNVVGKDWDGERSVLHAIYEDIVDLESVFWRDGSRGIAEVLLNVTSRSLIHDVLYRERFRRR